MNIRNFEKHVNSYELERGFAYYKIGCLENPEERKPGMWQTSVRGSDYKVEVTLNGGVITSSSCSCSVGSYCKHVIAMLYIIRNGFYSVANTSVKAPPKVAKPKPKLAKESFGELINRISLKEMKEFLITYAAEEKMFKNEFHAHFAHKSILQGRAAYATIVQRAINSNNSIRYKDVRKSLKPAETLLGKAADAVVNKDYRTAVDISFAVIDKVHALLVISKGDIHGGIGECIEVAFRILNEVADENISDDLKKHIYNQSFIEISSGKYKAYWYNDYWNELFEVTAYNDEMKKKHLV